MLFVKEDISWERERTDWFEASRLIDLQKYRLAKYVPDSASDGELPVLLSWRFLFINQIDLKISEEALGKIHLCIFFGTCL
jgi:hypothetical protein